MLACSILMLHAARSQQGSEADALSSEVMRLYQEGKYGEAIPLAQRLVTVREKSWGPDDPGVGSALNNLAALYRAVDRLIDAERLYRRALRIAERGADDPLVSSTLNNLAELCRVLGRYDEAETHYKRSIEIVKRVFGQSSSELATRLNNLARLYETVGRYGDAQPLYLSSLEIRRKVLPPNHPEIALSLNNLAAFYKQQGRSAEAERLYNESLAIFKKTLRPDHPTIGTLLGNLGELYRAQGRDREAETSYKQSLKIDEKALGPESLGVATTLGNLALLYSAQGRAEAEALLKRSLAIYKKILEPGHPDVGKATNNLSALYQSKGRYDEAERLITGSLAIIQKAWGPGHVGVGESLNYLADLYKARGRTKDAEARYKQSLGVYEKALGPDHPSVGAALNNLAELYRAEGRAIDAMPLYERSLALYEKALGPAHPHVGAVLNNMAWLAFAQRDWERAAVYWRRSTGLVQRRMGRGLAGSQAPRGEASRLSWQFSGLIKMTYRYAADGGRDRHALEMFETAQWAWFSDAAASLAQMAVRSAKGSPELARVVRERQDLAREGQVADELLIAAKSEAPANRKLEAERYLADRLITIDARLSEIDARLAKDLPDYAELASPKPISAAAVQAELRDNEALVLFLDTGRNWAPIVGEETFIWVVTKSDTRWVRSDLGTAALTRMVAALRCGLDEEEWSGVTRTSQCAARLGRTDALDEKEPLPFHLGVAHELYQSLFGPVEDLIKGKRLLIVPSGPLTSLPFHVLVTQKPETALPASFDGYRNVAWLGRSHAITVLPSVASLKALRGQSAGRQKAPDDYIGIGNPVLKGTPGACRADIKIPQRCPAVEAAGGGPPVIADSAGRATIGGGGGRRNAGKSLGQIYSQGSATAAVLTQVLALCPLPDTAHELNCVSKSFPRAVLRDKANASEVELRKLNANGTLARYRIVHFATHGLVAGDLETLAKRQGEPALVLTPPDRPVDADDDGLLTASEVAQLRLNADWVVLSACSTAAGDGANAEALSGLARAFFYAGARALLVSHWPVYSDAAVQLTTRTFAELERNPTGGRAEAFQRAMLALMDDASQASNAHPTVWAPFVVVGEGGADHR